MTAWLRSAVRRLHEPTIYIKMQNNVSRAEASRGIKPTDAEIITNYLKHLAKIVNEEEMTAIVDLFPIRTFKKGTVLLRAGQVANETYYVHKGLVRQYYLIDGDEKNTFFYTEGHSVSSMTSLTSRQPAKHFLACLEESTLSVIERDKETELYRRFPRFENMCRASTEEELGNYQDMLATYITSSPEERYFNLIESRPELLDRVPQYQLASFLGVKPETLSRIRKRIARNL